MGYSSDPEIRRAQRHAQYERHKDKNKARAAAWKTANPERKKQADRGYYEANVERKRQYDREYRQKNRERRRAQDNEYYRANSQKWRNDPKTLRRLETISRLWAEQDGKCYLCEEPISLEAAILEHDHRCCPESKGCCSGCVRGVACRWCNVAVGVVHDDPDRLERIARNLRTRMARVDVHLAAKPEQLPISYEDHDASC